jgi:hypothetical protein
MKPHEVIAIKYTPDGVFWWRWHWLKIKAEIEQAKELEDM